MNALKSAIMVWISCLVITILGFPAFYFVGINFWWSSSVEGNPSIVNVFTMGIQLTKPFLALELIVGSIATVVVFLKSNIPQERKE